MTTTSWAGKRRPLAFAVAAALLPLSMVGIGASAPAPALVPGQTPLFTEDFPAEEFTARRTRLAEAIGPGAIAVVQGAPSAVGYTRFRQSNELYYLTGIETPHAYLLIDGPTRHSTLYLPPRDARREGSEGKLLSAEDAELVMQLTGIDAVGSSSDLENDLRRHASQGTPTATSSRS